MEDAPKPGTQFHSAYVTALDWCDDFSQGQLLDDCLVASIAAIAMRDQVAHDRAEFLQASAVAFIAASILLLVMRGRRRRA